jgi:hypothetical protein
LRDGFFIISRRPSDFVVQFADKIAGLLPADVFIIANSGFDTTPVVARGVFISDADVKAAGFFGSTPLIPGSPTAWDKVIFFLAQKRDIRFAWIAEDDVFFTSPGVVLDMFNRYRKSDVDVLIAPPVFSRAERPDWPYWQLGAAFKPAEQTSGFVPLTRLSRKIIDHCAVFAAENRSLAFAELLFTSLAVKHSLSIESFDFLNSRKFRWAPAFGRWELLQKCGKTLQTGVFHPVKIDELKIIASNAELRWSRPSTWEILVYRIVGPPIEFVRYLRARAPGISKRLRKVLNIKSE